MMKQEAIARMKLLKLHPTAIQEFKEEGVVNVSEPPFAALYWADTKQLALIKEFESMCKGLVYHVVHTQTEFGELYNFFYVSVTKDEWESDRENIKNNEACVYVKNISDDWCSEFGYIGFKRTNGGLIRTE